LFKSLFIGVHVPSQKSEQFFCIYMLGVSILPLSTTFLLDYGTIPTVWYFFWNYSDSGIFWNCSDSVVFFLELPTVWYFLELFQQCGIFGTIPTVWYFFGTIPTVWYFWNCSDSGIFFIFHFIHI
jgi:hypothetical protein